jgi:hypothetical protein
MKTHLRSILLGACSLIACGSPESPPIIDLALIEDLAAEPDLGPSPPLPDLADPPNEASVSCAAPKDCHGSTPVCCSTLTLAGGTLPACMTAAIDISCKADSQCPTQLSLSCTGSDTLRLCTANSDCTEASYDKCCSFPLGGSAMRFCSSEAIAQIVGGSCL